MNAYERTFVGTESIPGFEGVEHPRRSKVECCRWIYVQIQNRMRNIPSTDVYDKARGMTVRIL